MTQLTRWILFLSFTLFVSRAEGQQLRFRHYKVEHGLSSNSINFITQDHKGFMWFGTNDGLNRFDGLSFRKYTYSEKNQNSVRNRVVTAMLEDRDHKIWIGTETGVDLYDPVKDSFSRFSVTDEQGHPLDCGVFKIIQDRDGDIWFATHWKGLFCFSAQRKKLKNYQHNNTDTNSLTFSALWDLFEDSRGDIWIGSSRGGLSRFSKEKQTFTNYRQTSDPASIGDNAIHKIYEDSRGNLWVGTFNNGLDRFNRETETFEHFLNKKSGKLLFHIHDIQEYVPGKLVISSDEGIVIYDIATSHTQNYKSVLDDETSLSDDFVYSIYKDREGSFWFGTYFGGVNFCSLYQHNFTHHDYSSDKNSLQGKVISCLCEDDRGNIWVGTDDNGLSYLNTQTGIFRLYRPGLRSSSSLYNIHALLFDRDKLWIGTYSKGLDVLDIKTGRFKNYIFDEKDTNTINEHSIYAIHKVADGRVFIGTTNGLCYYNPDKDHFTRLTLPSGISITDLLDDKEGTLWITTNRNGLFAFHLKTGKWKNYRFTPGDQHSLPDDALTTLCIDPYNRLWIGSEGAGLCRYDYKQQNFIRYENNGFPNQVINSIIPDSEQLWIATNKGLVRFNPDNETIRIFSRANGIENEQYTINSGIRTTNGRIYFGSVNGFDAFNPENITTNNYTPPVVITDMTIFNKSTGCSDKDSPLRNSIEYTEEIELGHEQSVIGFELASLSYALPEENRFSYLLEGFDKEWNTVGSQHRHITYTNLPAGKYTLRVRGSNNDNIWSPYEATLRLTVNPPFALSGIAILGYCLLLLSAIIFIVHQLLKRSERKHQEGLDKLNREKEREIYDAKLDFFTNIAHEIRTPLSLITGPLEYIMKSRRIEDEYNDYLNIIERNYQRLLALVNQLLDFRKIGSNRYEIRYSTIPFNRFVKEIIQRFEFIARQKKITLTCEIADDGYLLVSDEEALTKILSNLLTNAIKYARSNIRITADTGIHGKVRLSVSDDGLGVSDEEKGKIFELFYQSDASGNDPRKTGMGIGLHLTQSLVGLLHGEISVSNNANGEGTSFNVELPNEPLPAGVTESVPEYLTPSPLPIENDAKKGEKGYSDRFYTLLIVDDNVEIREFLNKFLSHYYIIRVSSNGKEALSLLENENFDLIISDIMMPEMNGLELCRIIKSNLNSSHTPVILLTAKTDTATKIEGLETGADAYLEKPFSPDLLRAQIDNLLQQRKGLREKFTHSPLAGVKIMAHSRADEELMAKISLSIKQHMTDPVFSVENLAEELCMSRTSLFVKIKAIVAMSPNDFIRLMRLKEAARLMVGGEHRVNEVCFLVGFNSASYFAKCFCRQFGVLPADFIKNLKNGYIPPEME